MKKTSISVFTVVRFRFKERSGEVSPTFHKPHGTAELRRKKKRKKRECSDRAGHGKERDDSLFSVFTMFRRSRPAGDESPEARRNGSNNWNIGISSVFTVVRFR